MDTKFDMIRLSGRGDTREMGGKVDETGFLVLNHGKIVLPLIKKVPGDG